MKTQTLEERYPWPTEAPVAVECRSMLCDSTRAVLGRWLRDHDPRLVVELGSFQGASARFILENAPRTRLVCVDTWLGNATMHDPRTQLHKVLPGLYDTFLCNLWEYRQRCVPLRADTLTGLRVIHDAREDPDLIFIDAGHDPWAVAADLWASLSLFPRAAIIGDDWELESVRHGVDVGLHLVGHYVLGHYRGGRFGSEGNTWWLAPL